MSHLQERAPFWAVDAVGIIVVGVLCALGKLSSETFVAITIAVLGLSTVSRVNRGNGPDDPPSNGGSDGGLSKETPRARRVARKARASLPNGGLASLVYALIFVLSFLR